MCACVAGRRGRVEELVAHMDGAAAEWLQPFAREIFRRAVVVFLLALHVRVPRICCVLVRSVAHGAAWFLEQRTWGVKPKQRGLGPRDSFTCCCIGEVRGRLL